MNCQVDDDDE